MKSKLIAGLTVTLFLVNMLMIVNSVSASIPGDLNGDGIVDIEDATICTLAMWSEPGDENWDPRADCAEPYGVIDIFDLVIVGVNFGQTA